nr:hypothetical protein [Tanacetum cinerariifolium]
MYSLRKYDNTVDKGFSKKISAGFYGDVISGLNHVDLNTFPEAIKCLLEKFSAGMTILNTAKTKSVSYAGAAGGARSFVPKKSKANFYALESKNLCEGVQLTIPIQIVQTISNREELTRILVWVKLHDVPLHVFSEDGISLIATQIGKLIKLDSFTSSMCIDSLGWSSFTHYLIEVNADEVLKDSITMGIHLPDGSGFSKEIVYVEYKRKPYRCEDRRREWKTSFTFIKIISQQFLILKSRTIQ